MKTKNSTTVTYSLSEIEETLERGEDDSLPDPPRGESFGPDFWKNARVVMPEDRGKTSVHLRLDNDILRWFKGHGKGHLTRMNAVLRSYVEAQKKSA